MRSVVPSWAVPVTGPIGSGTTGVSEDEARSSTVFVGFGAVDLGRGRLLPSVGPATTFGGVAGRVPRRPTDSPRLGAACRRGGGALDVEYPSGGQVLAKVPPRNLDRA